MEIDYDARPTARVISAGDGSTISIAGVTVTMKVTGAETGGACTIFESSIPPHFVGYEPYGHGHATATYYVTSGMLAFTIGKYGVGTLLNLGQLVATFYLTSAFFVVVILGLIARAAGFSLFGLLRYLREELLLVLGTSSSEPLSVV